MNAEYLDILREMQKYHALFGEFWSVGTLVENKSIPTAAIQFNETGDGLNFIINPDFWASLGLNEKCFILAHECLHVYFNHGIRFRKLTNKVNANKAGDIVINHYLVDAFGFRRKELKFPTLKFIHPITQKETKDADTLCWIDTIFPNKPEVLPKQSMEYYYGLMENDPDGQGAGNTLDDHESMSGQQQSSSQQEAIKEFVDNVTKRLSNDELNDFENKCDKNNIENNTAKQAGDMAGAMVKIIRLGNVKPKRKWEEIIKDTLGRFLGEEKDITVEQWAHEARRMACVGRDFMLPHDRDELHRIRDRIDVWFFQDTSGSCVSYAERFFKAAASIPIDRFKVRGFCFDTKTYEVDFKKGELKGFGGTAFDIIEKEIQNRIKTENCPYPEVVFVITDGYGSPVAPQYPDKWYWILTEGNSTSYIPPASKKFYLKDFE